MRLTNKQMEIIVDEIYDKVSKPIIKANTIAFDNIVLETDDYLIDKEVYELLAKEKQAIVDRMELLEDKYEQRIFNGYDFSRYSVFDREYKEYVAFQKNKLVTPKPYLSKSDIEKQVILAGNRDIPTLIEELIIKLSK